MCLLEPWLDPRPHLQTLWGFRAEALCPPVYPLLVIRGWNHNKKVCSDLSLVHLGPMVESLDQESSLSV